MHNMLGILEIKIIIIISLAVRIWIQNQLESINLTTGTNDHFLKYRDCIFALFTFKRDKTYN